MKYGSFKMSWYLATLPLASKDQRSSTSVQAIRRNCFWRYSLHRTERLEKESWTSDTTYHHLPFWRRETLYSCWILSSRYHESIDIRDRECRAMGFSCSKWWISSAPLVLTRVALCSYALSTRYDVQQLCWSRACTIRVVPITNIFCIDSTIASDNITSSSHNPHH